MNSIFPSMLDDICVTKCLGAGRFSDHQLAINIPKSFFGNTSQLLEIVDLNDVKDIQSLLKLIHKCSLMRHENLLSLFVLCQSNMLLISCPLYMCDCAQLLKVTSGVGVSEQDISHILQYVVKALVYLHSQYIIHRRIQPSAICIAADGHVFVRDLDDCIPQMDSERVLREVYDPVNYDDRVLLSYTSPDILLQESLGYTRSSDLYSISVLACELANGSPLFAMHLTPLQVLYEKIIGLTIPILWDKKLFNKLASQPVWARSGGAAIQMLMQSKELLWTVSSKKYSPGFHNFVKKCFTANRSSSAANIASHGFLTKRSQTRDSSDVSRSISSLLNRAEQFLRPGMSCGGTKCPVRFQSVDNQGTISDIVGSIQ